MHAHSKKGVNKRRTELTHKSLRAIRQALLREKTQQQKNVGQKRFTSFQKTFFTSFWAFKRTKQEVGRPKVQGISKKFLVSFTQ
jgi:hypothetical protein